MIRDITFFRSVTSMSGKPYDSIVWSTQIPLSTPEAQAVKSAKEELCKWAEVDDWIDIADSFTTTNE